MRPIFCTLALLILSSFVSADPGAAPASQPQTQAFSPDPAFEILQTYQKTDDYPSLLRQALDDMSSADAPRRIAATQYIDALLRRSLTDEISSSFSNSPESSAHRNSILNRVEQASQPSELAPTLLWILNNDSNDFCLTHAAEALIKNPTPDLQSIYKSLLTPGHSNTNVILTILSDSANRSFTKLLPDILPHCNDPRKDVRKAARDAAIKLSAPDKPNIPDYSPSLAFDAIVAPQLKAISSLLITPIPDKAPFKHFTIRRPDTDPRWAQKTHGWLISQTPDSITFIDTYGLPATCKSALVAAVDVAPDKYLAAALKDKPSRTSTSDIGLHKMIFAAWALQNADSQPGIKLLLPAFTDAPDRDWLCKRASHFLGEHYQQQMADAFIDKRDYKEAISIADHLSKPQFKEWMSYRRVCELATQLRARTDDFTTFTLPTPQQWQKLQPNLDRTAQINYLAARLRLLTARPAIGLDAVPMEFERPQTANPTPADNQNQGVINPLLALLDLNLTPADIPTLLPWLEDRNFLLAFDFAHWRDYPSSMYRISDAIVWLINDCAMQPLIDPDLFAASNPQDRQALTNNAAQWAATHARHTRTALLLETLSTHQDPDTVITYARKLTLAKETSALPLLLNRIAASDSDKKMRDALVECCLYLDPVATLPHARKWLADPKGPRFWAAVILAVSGDESSQEGVKELAAFLATDHRQYLQLHRMCFESLMRSRRPQCIALAAGVLKIIDTSQDFWDTRIQPFAHRLLLEGRPEALDFLLANLDNPAPQLPGVKRAKPPITIADTTAGMIDRMLVDPFKFGKTIPPDQRQELKNWLQQQTTLLREGKPTNIKPNPEPIYEDRWPITPSTQTKRSIDLREH